MKARLGSAQFHIGFYSYGDPIVLESESDLEKIPLSATLGAI
jgi:hypothetical protein